MSNLINLYDEDAEFSDSGYLVEAPAFTSAVARDLVLKDAAFPVPLDFAGQWAGYNFKHDAVKAFKRQKFTEGKEYIEVKKSPKTSLEGVYRLASENPQINLGGRPRKEIMMSVECFKLFLAYAHTAQGHEYRKFLIDAEEQLQATKSGALVEMDELEMIHALAGGILDMRKKLEGRINAVQDDVSAVREVVTKMQTARDEAAKDLMAYVPSGKQAKQASPRKKVWGLVGRCHEVTGESPGVLYNALYEQILLRYGKNIKVQAENQGVSKIDMVAQLGLMDELLAIAEEVLLKKIKDYVAKN